MPRVLHASDIPLAMLLKEAAGWNQTEQDWERLLELEPGGCFGIDCDGRLAATATVVCYGTDLAWIGMVLTLPEFRGRGLARRLMEHSLEYCAQRGVGWARLDATDMGAPLYANLGFAPECNVERWVRQPAPAAPSPVPRSGIDFALDREAFGADRSGLLALLGAGETGAVPGSGFAMGRPGSRASYFGPCASRTPEAARRLLAWYLGAHANESVAWDLLPDNVEAVALAREFGFQPARKLVRMGLCLRAGSEPCLANSNLVFAIAGFEFG